MKKRAYFVSLLCLMFSGAASAETAYLQVIQLVNFLANTAAASTGMTPTSVTVQFYDDASGKACWSTVLAYQADFTLRAGQGQACNTAVHQVTVTPVMVAGLLQTYTGPFTFNVDTTKYSNQIMLSQDTAPVFNTANGLVATPGTIKVDIQSQYKQ